MEIKQTVDIIASELTKILIPIFWTAITIAAKGLYNYASNMAKESQVKADEAKHDLQTKIATNIAKAMKQSPDHTTKESMKDGAVQAMKAKFPEEKDEVINALVELGVANSK